MKETWGAPSDGWPEFCECGKKRDWQETETEDGSYVLMDFHSCKRAVKDGLPVGRTAKPLTDREAA